MSMRFLALLSALVLLCSGCITAAPTHTIPPEVSAPEVANTPADPAPVAPPHDSAPVTTDSVPTPTPQPSEPDVPEYEANLPAVQIPDPQPVAPAFVFSGSVPESQPVDNSYFADAAFVGDSRMEGFFLYSGVKQGKLLSSTGLTVFSVDKKTITGGNQTVLEALSTGHYGKIYLGFGLNELGYIDTDAFVDTYSQLIDQARQLQPDAVIYIQNLIPVNNSKARSSGHKDHVNCSRIQLYNELIAQIAQDKGLPLLDLYSAFVTNGELPADASRDGVHLLPAYCKKQLDYLKTHTVTWEQLTTPVPEVPSPAPESPIETEATEV